MKLQLPHLKNPHKLKKTTAMKTRYKIAIVALIALAGSALLGGGFWWWFIALTVGRGIIEFLLTFALAMVLYVLFYALIIGGVLWLLIG